MSRHDLSRTLPWMVEGTTKLLGAVDDLPDAALAEPSALPGWTRAHVVGHVARNAEALTRLASWARTGVESPMYADRSQRAVEIEESAGYPPAVLRHDVAATAETLAMELALLDSRGWRAEVRSALGRTIPAAEIPWMRIREVWLHAVDLGTGASMEDLPSGVLDLLLDDVVAVLSAKDGCPAAMLVAGGRTWRLGPEPGSAARVSGTEARLAGWLTGRRAGRDLAVDGPLPDLPTWL